MLLRRIGLWACWLVLMAAGPALAQENVLPPDQTNVNILIGHGYTDVSPKQVVRTSDNVMYAVLIDCSQYAECMGNSVRVYRGDRAGVPTAFERLDQASESANAMTVAAALDGEDHIHIAYVQRSDLTNARSLDYRVFDTETGTFGPVETIDGALNYAGIGQGDQGVALAVDADGVPHVVYSRADGARRHLYYRSRTGGSWSDSTLVQVDAGVNYGGGLRVWHPNLAFDTEGRVIAAWLRGSFNTDNDGTIFARVRGSDGTWGSTVNVSGDNAARVHIDQGTSLLVTPDNRYHIAYVSAPDDFIRYAFSDDDGVSWTHHNPAGGRQATHNPSLGSGPGDRVRIYGHGTPFPAPDSRGDNLYYFEGEGGSSDWGRWTEIVAGSYDSSINTRWSQYFYHHPNYLDFVYWADPYPNVAYAAVVVWE